MGQMGIYRLGDLRLYRDSRNAYFEDTAFLVAIDSADTSAGSQEHKGCFEQQDR